MSKKDEIKNNDYNSSVSTYVEKEDIIEKVDIKTLNANIDEAVGKQVSLRKEISKIIKEIEMVA